MKVITLTNHANEYHCIPVPNIEIFWPDVRDGDVIGSCVRFQSGRIGCYREEIHAIQKLLSPIADDEKPCTDCINRCPSCGGKVEYKEPDNRQCLECGLEGV